MNKKKQHSHLEGGLLSTRDSLIWLVALALGMPTTLGLWMTAVGDGRTEVVALCTSVPAGIAFTLTVALTLHSLIRRH